MNKKITQLLVCLLSLWCVMPGISQAQTCSVNAGVGSTICVSGTMTLSGNATGALASTATWALVSGPNTPTITSATSPSTTVTGFVPGTYVFRYSATCSDAAAVSDSVTIQVSAIPTGFSAGRDTTVCGTFHTLNATRPAGTTGLWSYYLPPAPNGVLGATFSTPTSGTSFLSTSATNTCPKGVYAIWTVTQGACSASDTVAISFLGQGSYAVAKPDAAICATSYTTPAYAYGCGGSVAYTQLAGPSTATITPSSPTLGIGQATLSNLSTGTYTFTALVTPGCSGSVFRDTFNVTVGTTVPLTNPVIPGQNYCPQQFDTVYLFKPSTALLPGETLTWNLLPNSTYTPGATVASPIADTIGNTLRLRHVAHPDTNATASYWYYNYSYVVSNGTCSQTYSVSLQLFTPMGKKTFMPSVNLTCGATSGNIAIPTYGTNNGYGFVNAVALSSPAGAPAPSIGTTPGTGVIVSGLRPGKYTFKFDYFTFTSTCELRSAVVDVHVSAAPGLSNAGTDQLLACGVDSTTLAGNFPPAGQTGTWQLVSGPSTLVLTNPNSASLLVKNLLPGVYTLRWSIANGVACPASADNMRVVVTPNAPVASVGADRSVCYGYRTALTGNVPTFGVEGRWRQIGGPAVAIADTTAAITSFTGSIASTAYTFTWTLSNTCGTDTDTVVITTGTAQGPSDAVITTPDACITTASTTLTAISPATGTGSWYQLSGPGTATIAAPSSNSTTVSGLTGGEYKFVWRVTSGGCDTLRDTVSIAYRTATLTASAGPDRYVCKDTINLNANTPALGTGTWAQFGGPGSSISNIHSPVTGVSNLSGESTYDYVWTVSLGVCPAVSDSVHIGVSTPPSAAIARADTLVCGHAQGISATLNLPLRATTPVVGSGSWSFLKTPYYGGVIASNAAPVTTVSLYGGTTQVVWQVSNGACPASRDTVTFEITPRAEAGPASYNLCENASQNLQGSQAGEGTVLWSQLSGPTTATITNPNRPFTAINNMATGTYKFRYDVTSATVPGCNSFDTVIINNYAQPVANARRDSMFCYVPSGTVLYLAADTPALGTGLWFRTSGAGTVTYSPGSNVNPTRASVSDPGLHQFRWIVTNGSCSSSDYKDIFVEQLTVPAINFSPTTACNDSFSVSVLSPYSNFNYVWAFQRASIKDTSGINLTGPFNNHFLVSDTNNIYLTMTNPATGCTAKDSSAIIVDCSYLPLPLQLLSFDAAAQGRAVQLDWNTTNEKAIRLFHVERSADGRQWARLGGVNARGGEQRYAFTDQQAADGANLYRLRIEETDGAYTYSPVKMVMMGAGSGQPELLVYPNPASQQLTLFLAGPGTAYRYAIMNATGHVVLEGTVNAGAPARIAVQVLPAGTYLLKVNTDEASYTRKLQVVR